MLKIFRIVTASLFLISIPYFGYTLSLSDPLRYSIASLLLWGSLGAFCFTEGFMFKYPKRSKSNIYGARFFFVASVVIVAQLIFYLVSGQIVAAAA